MLENKRGYVPHFKALSFLLFFLTLRASSSSSSTDEANWRAFLSTPSSSPSSWDESNWRAFMSKPASIEETNWRDAMSKVTVGRTRAQITGFLGQDGSLSEAFFNESKEGIEDLFFEEPSTDVVAEFNGRVVVFEEEVKDVVACKESMQDVVLARGGDDDACLVTVPLHYARQFKWPASQLKARVQNVAHSPLLKSKRSRAWVHMNASTIVFLAGGPLYPKGAESYLDHLMQLVPELGIGTTTRVVLDVDCGTGSLSRALLGQKGVNTILCLGDYDSPENGVQLVMERGFLALLTRSLLGSDLTSSSSSPRTRLPFPSQGFDLVHCGGCNVSWTSNNGTLLFEADRILRFGGFFVWIMDVSNQGVSWSGMAIQVEKMCWKLVIRSHQFTVWQKPANRTSAICSNLTHVPLCSPAAPESFESKRKAAMMTPCLDIITEEAENNNTMIFAVPANWTSRLTDPPKKRLKGSPAGGMQRAKVEVFVADFNYWLYVTDFYVRSLGVSRVGDIRNVLDVNAGYGSFAAALAARTPPLPWWVLNVVPVDQPDRLGVIFDRGLLGLHHDWCEPLDSYARTFDLIHASRFFAFQHRCSAQVILLEIDRLLRPGGFALFRDHKEALLPLQRIARVLHWKAHIDDTESGASGTDKLLHCQKTRWTVHGSKPRVLNRN